MTADASAFAWRDPVPALPKDEARRPRWSVMIPTYRSARYLGQAIESVLAQDPGPDGMQIEVVDDGSDDDPEAVVRAVGGGRVGFFRQERNVGHIVNFHTCLVRSRGELVHLLHGDDFVRPGFYAALQSPFDVLTDLGAAFCDSVYQDSAGVQTPVGPYDQQEPGLLSDALVQIASEQRIMTPAIVVRRTVYETLGGFDRRLACAEDWEMWVRIAARFPIWYEPRPLAVYRMHDASNTERHVSSAKDAAYNRMAIKIFSAYLPRHRVDYVTRQARRTYALSALETARRLRFGGNWRGFFAQAREAFLLAPTLKVLGRAAAIAFEAKSSRDQIR
jgi:glycosyltransferase involved in cell wall biosynthesis